MLHFLPYSVAKKLLAALAALALLTSCQMDLHTKMQEVDANEMLGALLAAGLDARKSTPDGGKTWTISVERAQTVPAIEVLRVNALPRQRHQSLGDLFKKEGLISSPTEERVRFMFGIEQELAQTISSIDGVMVARVHIVLPNNDPLASQVKPSSASVFVKHRRETDLMSLVPSVKNLVVHAIEGLAYDQVTVTLVPATAETKAVDKPKATGNGADGYSLWAWLTAGGAALLVVFVVALRMGKLPAPLAKVLLRLRVPPLAGARADKPVVE